MRKGEESQISTRLTLADNVEAPVDQGQTLGQLEVYVGDELRDTVPILAAQPVDRLSVPASLPGIFLPDAGAPAHGPPRLTRRPPGQRLCPGGRVICTVFLYFT